MRLTRKMECFKRQKKSATKNPATHVSGKYELLQELGQQELLTPDGNTPCKSTAPRSHAGNEGFSQGPEAKAYNWTRRRKERMRWKDIYSSQLGQPQRLPLACTSTGSSQPTHRNHKPGFTWDYERFVTIEGCYIDVSGILPSM